MLFIRTKHQTFEGFTWYKSTGGQHYRCTDNISGRLIGEVYHDHFKGSWIPEVMRARKLVPVEGRFLTFTMAADTIIKIWKTGQGRK